MPTETAHPTALETLTAPVTVLVGHFGAGKSEIAVNLAFGWRERGEAVAVVDLDVVKPYFRSRLLRDEMHARGITLVVPQGDLFYADRRLSCPRSGAPSGGPRRAGRARRRRRRRRRARFPGSIVSMTLRSPTLSRRQRQPPPSPSRLRHHRDAARRRTGLQVAGDGIGPPDQRDSADTVTAGLELAQAVSRARVWRCSSAMPRTS
jgi:hypothetical protein